MTFVTDRKPLNRFDRWAVRVAGLMTQDPFSIRADATIREAISLLTTKGITAAPVINEGRTPDRRFEPHGPRGRNTRRRNR